MPYGDRRATVQDPDIADTRRARSPLCLNWV
jgi:hypothetical protein